MVLKEEPMPMVTSRPIRVIMVAAMILFPPMMPMAASTLVQIEWESLALSALAGLLVMFIGQAVKWSQIDDQFTGGIKIMGMVAIPPG